MMTTQGLMVIFKLLFTTWTTIWFTIDPQIGYVNLFFTIVFVMIPNNLKSEK